MEIYNMYSAEFPEFIKELLLAPEVKRLSDVTQICGVEYTSFPMFQLKSRYTRYDHSIGVALILWNFTHDVKQSIAGLLHDIASPCFAHVIDFMKNDHENQEATEENTYEIIDKSEVIQKVLKKYNLKTDDVANYHIYPLADNPTPMLSADRLEYTIGNAYNRGIATLEELKEMYNDLIVVKDENGIEELTFKTLKIAENFTRVMINNSHYYVADEDRFSMQYLADVVKQAYDKGLINEKDLFTTEKEIINKMCKDLETKELWDSFTKLKEIEIFDTKQEDIYCVNIPGKKRYINPLVIIDKETIRISETSGEMKNLINEFLALDFNKWISPKGK